MYYSKGRTNGLVMKERSLFFYLNLLFVIISGCLTLSYINQHLHFLSDTVLLVINIAVLLIAYFIMMAKVIRPWHTASKNLEKVNKGQLGVRLTLYGVKELASVSNTINQLTESISHAAEFIKGVGSGDLNQDYKNTTTDTFKDALKDALLDMRTQMQNIALEEHRRNWVAQGLAQFSSLLRESNSSMNDMGYLIVSNTISYLDANQGGIFIINDEDADDKYLELVASCAYDRKKHIEKRVNLGEGVLGQAFLEQETTYMKSIPEDYINITSGLGESRPGYLLIGPLKINEDVLGLVEIASFEEFLPYKIEFMEKLGENIAATISAVKANSKTQKLLDDTQEQTEQLKAQEEIMRQSNEEMQATQEALERKQNEVEVSQRRSHAIFENAIDGILVTDINGRITSINSACRQLFILPEQAFDPQSQERYIQQFLKKFNPTSPNSFLNRKRRSKIMNSKGETVCVEVYVGQEELDSSLSFLAYFRDISQTLNQEQQIAESLMQMDELRAQINAMKS